MISELTWNNLLAHERIKDLVTKIHKCWFYRKNRRMTLIEDGWYHNGHTPYGYMISLLHISPKEEGSLRLTPLGQDADFVVDDTLIYYSDGEYDIDQMIVKFLLVRFISKTIGYRKFIGVNFRNQEFVRIKLTSDSEYESLTVHLQELIDKVASKSS